MKDECSNCRKEHRFTLAVGLALALWPSVALADAMDSTNKWAWSENAGYLNFQATNATVSDDYAATVHLDGDQGYMAGWAWSEMVGWIKLGNTNGGVPYANTDATNWGVNIAGTNVSGFAWSEGAGWINFAPTNTTVTNRIILNTANGQFDGYAWSEMVGWVHLRGIGDTPLYALQSDTPTLVVLYDFHLCEENGQIRVCWETASEEETVGFDLYRWAGGSWMKVNDALIQARGQGGMGASYCVADAAADATNTFRYKLVETETDGTSEEYGPFDESIWDPRMQNLSVTTNGVVIRWLSREQDTYEIQRALNLGETYAPLATNIFPTPPVNAYTDQLNEAGAVFYRVRAE